MITGILLAAGSGLRLEGSVTPKQFIKINRIPLYQYALKTFLAHPLIQQIVLVVQESFISKVQDEVKPFTKIKPIHVIAGGEYRQDSSYLALHYLQFNDSPDFVVIHDVARPLITKTLLDKIISSVKKNLAVTLARKVNDSLFVTDNDAALDSYIAKSDVYLSQTPQAFSYPLIMEAHEHAKKLQIKKAIDDASLLKLMSKAVAVVPGSRFNFKVVTQDDLSLFKLLKDTHE
jgi:2-C-methyl-D-erythritol 4-phosphate cytidylyltransferase